MCLSAHIDWDPAFFVSAWAPHDYSDFIANKHFCKGSQVEMKAMQSGNVNCTIRGRGWGLDLNPMIKKHHESCMRGWDWDIGWCSLMARSHSGKTGRG